LTDLENRIEVLRAEQAKARAVQEAAQARRDEVWNQLGSEFQILDEAALEARVVSLESELNAELDSVQEALRRSIG
jgi:predicted CoA-binding protein